LPLEARVFPDKQDIIFELTQAVVIMNVALSGGRVLFSRDLLKDFTPYELAYLGRVPKKDDYSEELESFDRQQAERFREWARRDDEQHPALKNVAPETLATSKRSDESVNAIWIAFESPGGKAYKAVHVFHHPDGPYILLCSKDKDREDLVRVGAQLATTYRGTAEAKITERTDDICATVAVPSGFTQMGIAWFVSEWFRPTFKKVSIEAVYY
jgi:hypothetical protein